MQHITVKPNEYLLSKQEITKFRNNNCKDYGNICYVLKGNFAFSVISMQLISHSLLNCFLQIYLESQVLTLISLKFLFIKNLFSLFPYPYLKHNGNQYLSITNNLIYTVLYRYFFLKFSVFILLFHDCNIVFMLIKLYITFGYFSKPFFANFLTLYYAIYQFYNSMYHFIHLLNDTFEYYSLYPFNLSIT